MRNLVLAHGRAPGAPGERPQRAAGGHLPRLVGPHVGRDLGLGDRPGETLPPAFGRLIEQPAPGGADARIEEVAAVLAGAEVLDQLLQDLALVVAIAVRADER